MPTPALLSLPARTVLALVPGLLLAVPAAATGPDLPPWADEVREVRREVVGTAATVHIDLPAAAWGARGLRESDIESLHRLWLGAILAGDHLEPVLGWRRHLSGSAPLSAMPIGV